MDIKQKVKEHFGEDKVNGIDIDTIEKEEKAHYRTKEYKGELIKSHRHPDGFKLYDHPNPKLRELYRRVMDAGDSIYMIYKDGRLQTIQYHHPFVSGFHHIKKKCNGKFKTSMAEECDCTDPKCDLHKWTKEHVERQVRGKVIREVGKQIKEKEAKEQKEKEEAETVRGIDDFY